MTLWIGTSGWHSRHWCASFDPPTVSAQGWLDFHAQRFATVEINNAFYRRPEVCAFQKTVRSAAGRFRRLGHIQSIPRRGLVPAVAKMVDLGPQPVGAFIRSRIASKSFTLVTPHLAFVSVRRRNRPLTINVVAIV
jgi:hypothetical protein